MAERSIVRDGCTGEAMVAGTDVTVPDILVRLATDDGIARVLDDYPDLSREDVIATVNFLINASRADTSQPSPTPPVIRERQIAYGEPVAVDALAAAESEYERVCYELELITGIRDGLRDLRDGKEFPHEQVMAELREMLSK